MKNKCNPSDVRALIWSKDSLIFLEQPLIIELLLIEPVHQVNQVALLLANPSVNKYHTSGRLLLAA